MDPGKFARLVTPATLRTHPSFTRTRKKTLLATLSLALCFSAGPTASAQDYGLATRPSVGAFLDGTMPATPPALTSTWTPVVAFPNLHFDNAMGMLPMPGTNNLVVWEREGRILSNQCQGWDDLGLLAIAFHPDNGFLYLTNGTEFPEAPSSSPSCH